MKLYKYRIATDNYLGYEIQKRFILSLIWKSDIKSFATVEEAEKYYEKKFNKRVIKELN